MASACDCATLIHTIAHAGQPCCLQVVLYAVGGVVLTPELHSHIFSLVFMHAGRPILATPCRGLCPACTHLSACMEEWKLGEQKRLCLTCSGSATTDRPACCAALVNVCTAMLLQIIPNLWQVAPRPFSCPHVTSYKHCYAVWLMVHDRVAPNLQKQVRHHATGVPLLQTSVQHTVVDCACRMPQSQTLCYACKHE